MSKFLENQRLKQIKFKESSPYFSEEARLDGFYSGKPRAFCLPVECTDQNLVPEIRNSVLAHFAKHAIQWHKANNHLCSSQVCCVNFFFPFTDKPNALVQILRPIFPEIEKMLPVEDGQYVSFEWIGEKDYLGEKGWGTRGALCTSADAIVMFEHKDKKRQIVLIEWKYTESYGNTFLKYAKSGKNRTDIYRELFDAPNCPINKDILPSFDSLFYEPFYQLMRQQFLANEMERVREMGADIVSVLHIAPACNDDFLKITSSELENLGESATSIWKKLVKAEGRFISISTEQLFGHLSTEQLPEIKTWMEYIYARYAWVCE